MVVQQLKTLRSNSSKKEPYRRPCAHSVGFSLDPCACTAGSNQDTLNAARAKDVPPKPKTYNRATCQCIEKPHSFKKGYASQTACPAGCLPSAIHQPLLRSCAVLRFFAPTNSFPICRLPLPESLTRRQRSRRKLSRKAE